MQTEYFDAITVEVPRVRIYARMGYSQGITHLTPLQQEHIERAIDAAASLVELKGCCRRLLLKENDRFEIVLSDGVIFRSESLGRLLEGCEEAMLIGATAGSLIVEAIVAGGLHDELSGSVVFDAVASEMVDSALGWIIDFVNRDIRRTGRYFTERRFSPGYGDFILANQRIFYTAMEMEKMGVRINDRFMLEPEKSVTAIIGIKRIPEEDQKMAGGDKDRYGD